MATAKRSEILDYAGLSNLEILISDIDKLVSLPDVYYRLESLIERPDSTLEDFARVLEAEPDLCARLLSLANSAFYSFPSSIETIDKAVQIIGIRQIRELVLATSVIKAFNQMPLGMVNMKLFWEHSVAVGVLAKSIGQYCHLSQPERFYVSGLLHDLGRLIFYIKMPGLMHDLLIQREAQEAFLYVLEQQALGYSHAEAGGYLLKNWRVPDSIYEPVLYHHDTQNSTEYGHVTAAVHIADAWVNKQQLGSSGERFEVPINPFALETLNIEVYEMDVIWELAEEDIKSVFQKFMPQ
ncbi:MAG: HDOD domain-containing protein [Gammaproteobacteria bacterium]|nr:HDOD domain-containing protein [Gammaproteobacteria bacterium]